MMKSHLLEVGCRGLLAIALIFFGGAKAASEYDGTFIISREAYYAVAMIEICSGLLLCIAGTRGVISASLVAIAISVTGIFIQFLYPGKDCGCGAFLKMQRFDHILVSSTLGALACGVLVQVLSRFTDKRPQASV